MKAFVKQEPVFLAALILTLLSFIFVPPGLQTASAIDFRTLGLLFCLMGVSSGLRGTGFFGALSKALMMKASSFRSLSIVLTLAVFFSSMLVTNDVGLIVFVPFTLSLLEGKVDEKKIISLVVLETVAANLGSMATPVGNPQNLYLYSKYSLGTGEFFVAILPTVGLSLLLVTGLTALLSKGDMVKTEAVEAGVAFDTKKTASYFSLLALALLSVLKVLDWRILLAVEIVYLVVFDRQVLRKVDYILLLTFVCFFIFSDNIGQIGTVRDFLAWLLEESAFATSVLTSQLISNVPAAVLLSPFTDDWKSVVLGTDIGGLGTPIASLASLISLKFYMARKDAMGGRYLLVFSIVNFGLLAVLCFAALPQVN